jgi:hypothetical protein
MEDIGASPPPDANSSHEKAFIEELDREIGWEWKWEKRHRYWNWGVNWATWLARLFLLAFSWYQLTGARAGEDISWVVFWLAFLSMFNIALPLLAYTFRFQQRQEVHDTHAREYCAIRVEFLSGQIRLSDAVQKFTQTRRKPTEKVIRATP